MSVNDYLSEPLDKVDSIDIASVLATTLGAGTLSGFMNFSVAGYSFSDVAYTLGSSTDLSLGLLAIIVGVLLATLTNGFSREEFSMMSDGEKVAVVTPIAVPLLTVLSPDLLNFVSGNMAIAGVFTAIHAVAILVIASE